MNYKFDKQREKTIEDIKGMSSPFEDDLLGREKIAHNFVTIIKNSSSPFVFNINAPYGTGKTFFLKRLKVLLEKEGCPSVLFNSWETDWINEPLVAILAELTNEINILISEEKPWISKAKKSWAILRQGLEIAIETILKTTSPIASKTLDILEKEKTQANYLTQYLAGKEALNNLTEKLTALTKMLDTPLVIIVDELDRCRPDYAIKTLETIKHLFNIPQIIFILAVDRSQIESAVSTLYGKKIEDNCDEYLRKFIDYDFYLPNPNRTIFVQTLFNLHIKELILPFCKLNKNGFIPINSQFSNYNYYNFNKEYFFKYFIALIINLGNYFNFSLRAQEQVILRLRILLSALTPDIDLLLPEVAVWIVSLLSFSDIEYQKFIDEKKIDSFLLDYSPRKEGNNSFIKLALTRKVNFSSARPFNSDTFDVIGKSNFSNWINASFNRNISVKINHPATLQPVPLKMPIEFANKYVDLLQLLIPVQNTNEEI